MADRTGTPLVIILFAVSLQVQLAVPDWTDCPAVCRCKWTSGKKSALCPSVGFTAVPNLNPEIQVLDLSGNLIPYLTRDAFKSVGLVNLQRIFLRSTALQELHPEAFRELTILVEVDLSQNQLTKIHPDTFMGNDRLRYLNLSGNPLQTLEAFQFPLLPYLKTVELEYCQLRRIHQRAFERLPQLETLNLNGNFLSNISEEVFSSRSKLKTLMMDANPWRCDCGLRGIRQWIISRNVHALPLLCKEPPDVGGKLWQDLSVEEFACSPIVTISEQIHPQDLGSNVTFRCFVQGDPEPRVTWLFNGVPLNITNGDQVTLEEGIGIEKWTVLNIYNVTDAGAGEYTCHAQNIRGSATANATLLLPEVVTATKLGKAESWLLVAGLVAGAVATIFSISLTIVCTMCLCGRQRRRQRRRRKGKLKESMSFTDQEKKLLDVSITTTERASNAESIEHLGEVELSEAPIRMSEGLPSVLQSTLPSCEPVRITIESRTTDTLTVYPPPPAFAQLPPGAYPNIFISVSVGQEPEGLRFPDLLDTTRHTQVFATLPRRPKAIDQPVYDNMGPRVTAGGSSTLSLHDTDELPLPSTPSTFTSSALDYVSL